jgi:hypothetical protein
VDGVVGNPDVSLKSSQKNAAAQRARRHFPIRAG